MRWRHCRPSNSLPQGSIMKLHKVVLILGLLSASNGAQAEDTWPHFFDQTDKTTQAEVLRLWKVSTIPYEQNGRIARNCAEFLTASGGSISSDTISPQAEAVFGSCAWLSLLAHAKPPQRMLFNHNNIAKDMAEHLELGSIPWAYPQAGTPSELGRKHLAKLKTKNANMTFRAKVLDFGTERTLEYSIQFLASADFDGSGRESVVALYSINEDLHMSSGNSSLLQEGTALLTRSEPSDPIVAKPFVVVAP